MRVTAGRGAATAAALDELVGGTPMSELSHHEPKLSSELRQSLVAVAEHRGYSWVPLTEVLGGYVSEIAPVCIHNTALKSGDDPFKIVIRLVSVKLTG